MPFGAMARAAAGMHLVIATQRPSVMLSQVLSKRIFKPYCICGFLSQIDSRTILDMGGAEKVTGTRRYAVWPQWVRKSRFVFRGCYG